MEEKSKLSQIIKMRITISDIKKKLEQSKEFNDIIQNLTFRKNEKNEGNALITDLEGIPLNKFDLENIYHTVNDIVEACLSYADFLKILRSFIFKNLDIDTKKAISYEINLQLNNLDFLEGNIEKLEEKLSNLEEKYIKYETICDILNTEFSLDISINDPRVSKVLTFLGYKKIRKSIDGVQQRVWIKNNLVNR